MTPEERIAQLEAELAEERAERRRLSETLRVMAEAQVRLQTAEAERRAVRSARNARHRSIETSHETRAETSPSLLPSLPPPFPSPSLPAPISPPPISSPNPSLSPSFPPSAVRDELRLEPQVAAKRTRATKREDKPTDPRHAPLCKALEAAGWPHHGGRTAKAVAELLALADRMPPGLLPLGVEHPAVEEVLRRARLAMAHEGFPRVREVHELPRNWGHFESAPAPARGPAPPSDFSRPAFVPERSPFAPEVSDEPF